MQTASFGVPSISCSACSEKIKQGIGSLKGIGNIDVDLGTRMVKVEYDPRDIQPVDIKKRVMTLGYEVE